VTARVAEAKGADSPIATPAADAIGPASSMRAVVMVLSALTAALGALMLVPAFVSMLGARPGAPEDARAFALCAAAFILLGAGGALATRGPIGVVGPRDGFVIIALSWLVLCAGAAAPLAIGPMDLTRIDAFFESVSGLTTTGATVVTGLDAAPEGFLIWRAMLQWIGGVGVVIMAIAVMPFLSVGGMQLFRLESSDRSDQLAPRAKEVAAEIFRLYLLFTLACVVLYRIAGMGGFDAFAHAMTTISTGGFSTHDASFGHFADRPALDAIAIFFMIVGGLPFGVFMLMARGRADAWRSDPQLGTFFLVLAAAVLLVAPDAAAVRDGGPTDAFRAAAFNVASVVTGTGYATDDYGLWGPFAVALFFCLTFLGACAGSTSCGMKIFRLQIVFAAVRLYARRLTHPHAVSTAIYNRRPVSEEDFTSVLSFVFVYFAVFATLAAALGLLGLDPTTALSASATAIANVGPGLGDVVGPAGNFQTLSETPWRSDAAKVLLTFGMLLGRLEFFAILVLLTPAFWRH